MLQDRRTAQVKLFAGVESPRSRGRGIAECFDGMGAEGNEAGPAMAAAGHALARVTAPWLDMMVAAHAGRGSPPEGVSVEPWQLGERPGPV